MLSRCTQERGGPRHYLHSEHGDEDDVWPLKGCQNVIWAIVRKRILWHGGMECNHDIQSRIMRSGPEPCM